MKTCKKCGAKLNDNDVRCPWCGALVEEDTTPTPPVNEPDKEEENLMTLLRYADLMDDNLLLKTALCKLNGVGVAKNTKEAFELFRVLAFRGNFEGMYNLAMMMIDEGDRNNAYRWLKIAASAGHKPSALRLMMDFNEMVNFEKTKAPNNVLEEKAGGFDTLVEKVMPSIVMIEAVKQGNIGSQGSGFIIEGGYVVTNEHVVSANPMSITCKFENSIDNKEYNLKPVMIAREYDLAILEFTGEIANKIKNANNLSLRLDAKYGEEVYTVGNPIGLGFSVSRGVVSNPKRETNYQSIKEVIQTDITANPGNSGGALLDKKNQVIGVITYHPGDIEGAITMCVPSKYIVELLNKIN